MARSLRDTSFESLHLSAPGLLRSSDIKGEPKALVLSPSLRARNDLFFAMAPRCLRSDFCGSKRMDDRQMRWE